jgi:hypothetical protein
LQRQVKLLADHPDYDLTYCNSEIMDQNGRLTGEMFSDQFPLPSIPSGNLFEVLCTRNFINMMTIMARKSVREQLYFDERIKWVEDWWQWIRVSYRHRFLYEPAALARYRVHSQSTGITQKAGISRNRWKVGRRNLQNHLDLPLRLQSVIWYQMGVDLCDLGKRRRGCQFLRQALACGWKGGLAGATLFKIGARLGWEWSRKGPGTVV